METKERKCGILMHPTSFNSPYGIGDLGIEAREMLKRFADAGITLWQILPLGPTGYGDSPYSSRSCFAGNEYLIDLRSIDGIKSVFEDTWPDKTARVDYSYVASVKMKYLRQAATEFIENGTSNADFSRFCTANSWWLDDYALFQSLVTQFNDSRWYMWETKIKNRDAAAVEFWKNKLASEIMIYKVLQYFFFKQWDSLHAYAKSLGIQIVGDIPIFAAADSVDAWANRELFKITKNGVQKACAGVPPDAFCATGQMWGNPVYDWKVHEKDDFLWWRKRVEMTFRLVDIVRIDHFRGFESYWEIPAGSPDATYGTWKKAPGMKLLKHFKEMNIIAEDLGVITPEVEKLRDDSGFPGMKVLQFAFDLRNGKLDTSNMYLPFCYIENCVAYTGTHDNQTSRGWFNCKDEAYKDIIRRYLQSPDEDVVWQMIRSILASPAKYTIIPIQDIMGEDDKARMNCPSTLSTSNWSWRINQNHIQQWQFDRLHEFINLYGRGCKTKSE